MAPVIGPSAHTDTHARRHSHAHTGSLFARGKQSTTGEGPPGLFIAPILLPPRLPDVTSQQSEIIFSGIIVTTHAHTWKDTRILSLDFFLHLYLRLPILFFLFCFQFVYTVIVN